MNQGLPRHSSFGSTQLSHVFGSCDEPLIESTIGEAFDITCAKFSAHEALASKHQGIKWTYRELSSLVDGFALGLLDLGLLRGDRVGLWAPNCAEWTVVQYAAAKVGLILVNLNPAYRVSEIEYAINKVGCKALVLADTFRSSNYLSMLFELAPELHVCPPTQLVSKRLPTLRTVIQIGKTDVPGVLSFEQISKPVAPQARLRLQRLAADILCTDAVNIQFTSGTTGFPKAAVLSHRNLLNAAYFTGKTCGIDRADSICVPLPLFHIFGMAAGNLLAMLMGAKVVYPGPAFDPAAVLKAVEDERCTALYGVPTMFLAEMACSDFERRDLSSLKKGVIGGASVSEELMRRVISEMHMTDTVVGYGMTETSSTIMLSSPSDSIKRRTTTVGKVAPHVEVKVIDSQGEIVLRGISGEICVRGYSAMIGYWADEQKTAQTIDDDGWVHTGDLGIIDDAGYGRIVGRIKDLVIRGGENISPSEIEDFLHSHPSVESVYVVGVPDAKYGEELCACIRLRREHSLQASDLISFCEGHIAHFKIPRYFRFVEDFPMTASGKIQKYLLAQESANFLGVSI